MGQIPKGQSEQVNDGTGTFAKAVACSIRGKVWSGKRRESLEFSGREKLWHLGARAGSAMEMVKESALERRRRAVGALL